MAAAAAVAVGGKRKEASPASAAASAASSEPPHAKRQKCTSFASQQEIVSIAPTLNKKGKRMHKYRLPELFGLIIVKFNVLNAGHADILSMFLHGDEKAKQRDPTLHPCHRKDAILRTEMEQAMKDHSYLKKGNYLHDLSYNGTEDACTPSPVQSQHDDDCDVKCCHFVIHMRTTLHVFTSEDDVDEAAKIHADCEQPNIVYDSQTTEQDKHHLMRGESHVVKLRFVKNEPAYADDINEEEQQTNKRQMMTDEQAQVRARVKAEQKRKKRELL